VSVISIDRYRHSLLMQSMENVLVSEAMHPGIVGCEPEASLTDVARTMATHRVRAIAVMGIGRDEHGERLAWGLISDAELVRAATDEGHGLHAIDLAVESILTVEPDLPVRTAAELMLEAGATHVVVVDEHLQRPIGILSLFDIVELLARSDHRP